ncbi:MAG: IS256 family transposase [Fimbriimonadales bacterium]
MSDSTSVSLFSSVEDAVRVSIRDLIEGILEEELTTQLARARYERGGVGYRNGHRERTIYTVHGAVALSVPRGRIQTSEGVREFRPSLLPAHRRMSPRATALIVACYLCGVSTRKVQRALALALGGNVSRSTVSRCLATLKPTWEVWKSRDLSKDGVVRLILDGFSVRVRLACEVLRISVLVAMGVLADGQKVLLSLHGMGGESKEAWREVLEDLLERGLGCPELCMIDGSKGLRAALGDVWPQALVQRCTVHKERNLLAYAPEDLHEELTYDYKRMIYAPTAQEVVRERARFLGKWRKKCPKVATSLEEAGAELFTFLRFPMRQWKGIRTTNAIESLNKEFRRRVKVQGTQPGPESVCMLLWALLSSGAVTVSRIDGWQTIHQPIQEDHLAA